MAVIAQVEDAIIEVLTSVLGNHVRGIETLSGPWTLGALKRALQFAPCVRVAFLGGRASRHEDAAIDARFGVYFVAGQGGQSGRGVAGVIGLYDMLEIALPALNELTVPGIGSLFLVETGQQFAEQTLHLGGAVYGATFELPNLVLPSIDSSAALNDFVTFHADSDITGDGAPEITTEEVLPQ
ncbi:MAG: DUF1834 family protein [Gammaproteobacteria bacterium]|nr:MAG: DUF1834 family protein [Gammaproteobacteria bacterium]